MAENQEQQQYGYRPIMMSDAIPAITKGLGSYIQAISLMAGVSEQANKIKDLNKDTNTGNPENKTPASTSLTDDDIAEIDSIPDDMLLKDIDGWETIVKGDTTEVDLPKAPGAVTKDSFSTFKVTGTQSDNTSDISVGAGYLGVQALSKIPSIKPGTAGNIFKGAFSFKNTAGYADKLKQTIAGTTPAVTPATTGATAAKAAVTPAAKTAQDIAKRKLAVHQLGTVVAGGVGAYNLIKNIRDDKVTASETAIDATRDALKTGIYYLNPLAGTAVDLVDTGVNVAADKMDKDIAALDEKFEDSKLNAFVSILSKTNANIQRGDIDQLKKVANSQASTSKRSGLGGFISNMFGGDNLNDMILKSYGNDTGAMLKDLDNRSKLIFSKIQKGNYASAYEDYASVVDLENAISSMPNAPRVLGKTYGKLLKEVNNSMNQPIKALVVDDDSANIPLKELPQKAWGSIAIVTPTITKDNIESLKQTKSYTDSNPKIKFDETETVLLNGLSNVISSGESSQFSNPYDAGNKEGVFADGRKGYKYIDFKPTETTIGDILKKGETGEVYAVGKYQFIPSTLLMSLRWLSRESNIPMQDLYKMKLTDQVQDKLFITVLKNKRPAMWKFLTSQSVNMKDLEDATDQSAKEWSSIEYRGSGKSRYKKDNATIGTDEWISEMLKMRASILEV